MPKGLFNKKSVSAACAHCRYGRKSADDDKILCAKKGIMSVSSSCRSYKYDALKRVPKKLPKLQKYSASDFEI